MLRNVLREWLILVLFFLICVFLVNTHWDKPLNQRIYDLALRFQLYEAAEDITIVAIDEKSLKAMGRWPWPRDVHAQLVDVLIQHNAKAIAFDILFVEENVVSPEGDKNLIAAIERAGNVVLPVYIGALNRFEDTFYEQLPFKGLEDVAAGLGHVQFDPDQDGIGRAVYLRQGLNEILWPHFTWSLYRVSYPGQLPINLSYSKDDLSAGSLRKQQKYYIPYVGGSGSFRIISYVDVLLGRVSKESLENKIIFVGATAAGLGDTIVTPVTTSEKSMSGVEGHANIFNALRIGNLIQWAPQITSNVLVFLFGILICVAGMLLSARSLFFMSVLAVLLTLFVAYLLLRFASVWLPVADPIILLSLAYPLWSLQRLNQAIKFLQEELMKSKGVPNLLNEQSSLTDVQAKLNCLLDAKIIEGWWIDDADKKRVASRGRSDALQFSKTGTVDTFELNETLYRFGCIWDNKEFKSKFENRLVDLNPLKIADPELKAAEAADVISASINYLKSANQNVRSTSNMTRGILQKIDGGVIVADVSGRLIFSNEKAKQWLQLEELTLENRHIFSMTNLLETPEGNLNQVLYEMVYEGKNINQEVQTQEGKQLLFYGEIVRPSMQQQVILITLADITEVKALQRSRAESLRFLSHDLRSPMVSILALIQQYKYDVQNKSEQDPQEQVGEKNKYPTENNNDELLEKIAQMAETNLSLATDYLQVIRVEQEPDIRFDLQDPVGLFENAMAEVYEFAQQRNIKIKTDWGEEFLWVNGNAGLLETALQNLVDNAIKYSSKGETIELSLNYKNNQVGFVVKDCGMGIPEEEMDKLFGGFYRASNAKQSHAPGTGLGLRFVDIVAQRHRGSIEINSQIDQGSTFIMWLPAVINDVE